MRYAFVKSTVERLLREGVLTRDATILAVAAAEAERDLFEELGFREVTISNLDDRLRGDEFAPFAWSYQDAQALTFEDASFDFAFVSDGLHHCDSPHRALLEMYRVARRGVLVFESRDSLVMRLANRLNLTPSYELEAVVGNDFSHGGVNNTAVPNYIYRWTEREFEKTIRSHNPTGPHGFRYFYGLNLPFAQAEMKKSRAKFLVLQLARPALWLATRLFKKQCNSFGMLALKPAMPGDLWPWLERDGEQVRFNVAYARAIFKDAASPQAQPSEMP